MFYCRFYFTCDYSLIRPVTVGVFSCLAVFFFLFLSYCDHASLLVGRLVRSFVRSFVVTSQSKSSSLTGARFQHVNVTSNFEMSRSK